MQSSHLKFALTRRTAAFLVPALVSAAALTPGSLWAQAGAAKTGAAQTDAAQTTGKSATQDAKTSQCDIVAHRGFSSIAPENALVAIKAAIEAGATGCEFDVYACASGEIVLMHDKTLKRTTNGTGSVTALTLQELQKLDAGSWKGKRYAGEPVPTLTAALKLLKSSGCQPVIEIKMEGIAKQVIQDVRKLDMVDQVAVIAFSQNVVREIRKLEPTMQCAWLCSKTPAGSSLEKAQWLQQQARKCDAKLLDLNYKMLTADLITELQRQKLGVWTWTVNDQATMEKLNKWGVNSITTDRPDLLKKVLN